MTNPSQSGGGRRGGGSLVLTVHVCVCVCRVGHNEIIGVMRVGCNAEGLGRDHWNEMLAYPRKPIAHWHPLLEPKKSEKEVGGGFEGVARA